MYNIFSFLILCLSCVRAEDCLGPKYKEWCPAKPKHILCERNNYIKSISVSESDTKLVERYSNYFRRNQICGEINKVTVRLLLDKYLIDMAIKALSNKLWYRGDVCFATNYHPNVRILHFDLNEFSIDALTSLMNVKAWGCANSTTDMLCLFSDDDPFRNLQMFVAYDSRYCGLDYDRFHSGICYLGDTTANAIVNQLNKFKIRWDKELEYLAQGSIASNTTNICYTKDQRQIKLSYINYQAEQISKFNVEDIIVTMIRKGVFDILDETVSYSMGCTFYDIQRSSLRILCVYDKLIENDDDMDIIRTMANGNAYIIYGLIMLVYTNIIFISFCIRIMRKLRIPSNDDIYSTQPIYSTPQ